MDNQTSTETNHDVEEFTSRLYSVYCKAVGGKAFNGYPLPDWNEFAADPKKQAQVHGWRAVCVEALLFTNWFIYGSPDMSEHAANTSILRVLKTQRDRIGDKYKTGFHRLDVADAIDSAIMKLKEHLECIEAREAEACPRCGTDEACPTSGTT